MPKLAIKTELEITDGEADLLCDTLQCERKDLEREVARYSTAALREYVDMFIGAATPTSATEIRERRLVWIMLTAFPAAPPGAEIVSRLFNITPSAARSLLRSVTAKHRLRLKDQTMAALKAVLNACKHEADGSYSVIVVNPILVELLNARIATSLDPKTPIERKGDSIQKYTISAGSYAFLQGELK